GDLIGQGASAVGSMIGNMIVPGFGGQIGGAIGNAAGGIAQQLIPFSVAPGYGYQQAYVPSQSAVMPQGFFGDLVGQGAPVIGSMIGNHFAPGIGGQIGGAIGNAVGGIGQQLIPFSVAPAYGYQQAYAPAQAAVMPQGFFGDLIGQGASAVGSMIGNMIVPGFGGQIGGAIGNAAGGIAQQLIPFSVAPGYGYQPVSYYNPELAQGDALQMAGNSMQKIAKALPVIVNVGGIPPLVQWYINALGGSNPPPPPPSQNSNTSTQMKSLALQSLGLGDAKWGNASQGSTFARSRLSI
ncbi:hypothetical protein, partial [Rhizobium paknamense]|nr:hypothetical protein [Rhizobium paknamense]